LPTPDPPPLNQQAEPNDVSEPDEAEDSAPLADVIPLGVFDAREEAKRWW